MSLPYRGKTVAAREISDRPYLDDPLRARFEKLANKQYVFTCPTRCPVVCTPCAPASTAARRRARR